MKDQRKKHELKGSRKGEVIPDFATLCSSRDLDRRDTNHNPHRVIPAVMSGCVFLSETESRHQLAGLFQRICGEMAKVLLTLWTQLYYLMLGKCRAGYECRARWPTAGHCL